jgi:hypothetical protein
LECARFIGAFDLANAHTKREGKAALKRTQSKRWRDHQPPKLFDVSPNPFPTTAPMTEPMIAPAAKSENQWMVMETPRPT